MTEDLKTIEEKIEDAHRLGILSDEEYCQKIALIDGHDAKAQGTVHESNLPVTSNKSSVAIDCLASDDLALSNEAKSDEEDDGIVFFNQISGEVSNDHVKFVGADNVGETDSPKVSKPKKIKKKNVKKILLIILLSILGFIGALIILGLVFLFSEGEEKPVDIQWSELELGALLPEPSSPTGTVDVNDSDELRIDLFPMQKEAITAYIDESINDYFKTDVYHKYDSKEYAEGFNDDGYKLSLHHYGEDDEKLSILVEAPIKMNALSWPSMGIGSKLPKPKAEKGKIKTESTNSFAVYIGDTTEKECNEYIDDCMDKGYSVDYYKEDRYFSANNKRGDDLTVEYYGNNTMYISVFNWDLDEEDVEDETTKATTKAIETKKESKKKTSSSETEKPSGDSGDNTKLKKFVGKKCFDVTEDVEDLGYTPIYLAANTRDDMTSSIEWEKKEGYIESEWTIANIHEIDTKKKTVTYIVTSKWIRDNLY